MACPSHCGESGGTGKGRAVWLSPTAWMSTFPLQGTSLPPGLECPHPILPASAIRNASGPRSVPAAKQPSAGNSFQSGLAGLQRASSQLLYPAASAPELPTPRRASAPPAVQAPRLGASIPSIPVPACAAGQGAAGSAQPALRRWGCCAE